MSGDLFVKKMPSETIERFCEKSRELLGLNAWEQRFSDNYAEGTYFRTNCLGVRVQVEVADDSDVAEYDFHMHFRPGVRRPAEEDATMEGLADLVAVELATAGYSVLRLSPILGVSSSGRVRRRCVLASDGSPAQFVRE
jgi:hypothetical protein